uniref:Globin family profile domain-containing protein n=1 Tax=Acrobeloides nanus TaxID=290746 RepID=A0A914ED43_9BILA
MFLISKIVRGRRLLHELQHELQQEEETKKNSLSEKANNQVDHRNQRQLSIIAGGESSSPNAQDDANLRNRQTSQRRNEIPPRLGHSCSNLHLNEDGKTTRQKTESSNDDENSSNILAVPTRMRRTSSMPSVSDVPQHKISMQPRVRHYNYNARLNKLQKRSLRFTWQRLQTRNGGKKIEDVFNEVFERLMKQVPIMRDMFTTRAFLSAMSKNDVATLRDHARIIVRMFDLLIINLDKEPSKRTDTGSEFDPRLLGKAHGCLKPYRFTANIWEILGETIIDVVLCQEAVRDLPGAGQAWVVLTACVVDQSKSISYLLNKRISNQEAFQSSKTLNPIGMKRMKEMVKILQISIIMLREKLVDV